MTIILYQTFINQRTRSNGSFTFFSISKYGAHQNYDVFSCLLVSFRIKKMFGIPGVTIAIIETMPNSIQKSVKAWRTFFDLVKTRENSKW